jgi:large subunit ribosomal protein L23
MTIKTGSEYNVILSPVLTEKSYNVTEDNKQSVFKVASWANKIQVKKAVEKVFGVKVLNVNILNRKGKLKTFKNKPGRRKANKIAYVTCDESTTIDYTQMNKD